MIEGIIVSILAAVVLAVLGWFVNARFLDQPRIKIEIQQGPARSSAGSGDKLNLTWHSTIALTNVSNHDALEMETLFTASPTFSVRKIDHIKGLDAVAIEHTFQKQVDEIEVIRTNHDFWGRLCPDEYDKIFLIIEYRNSRRFRFYTTFEKSGGKTSNRYSKLKPRSKTPPTED